MKQTSHSISAKQNQAQADRLALRWCAAPALLAGIVSLTWFLALGLTLLPVKGSDSIGRMAIICGILTGLLVFPVSFIHDNKQRLEATKRWVWVRDIVTFTFAYNVVLAAALALLTQVLNAAFKGLLIDPYTSSLIVTAVVAAAAYIMIYCALTVNLSALIAVLATILIGGVLFSMITNSQADWWQVNLSYLGMPSDSATWLRFNLTLIFSSLVMLALTDYIFARLEEGRPGSRGIVYLKWLFVAVALALGGVGLFPYVDGSILGTLHNLSATALVLVIIAMIVGLRWFVPWLTPEFFITSYAVGVGLAIEIILYKFVGYLSLTAFEIVAFGISFTWLIMLLRSLDFAGDITRKETLV